MTGERRDGFTLVELMIVIAVIAVVVTIAIPSLVSSRMRANETSAIQMLRSISSAQTEFRTKTVADEDGDGAGEYGYFAELSGLIPPRASTVALQPPILSSQFRVLDNGRAKHSGYMFRMYLPDANGIGLGEAAKGGTPGNVDPDLAEVFWCCYAWPTNAQAGERAFFVNQQGELIQSNNLGANQKYAGDVQPQPDAAFLNPSTGNAITGTIAVSTSGTDGGTWVPVQ